METKRTLIEVTKLDIREGKKTASDCPIAKAILRVTGNPIGRVWSNFYVPYLQPLASWKDVGRVWIPLPIRAQRFIKRFDSGKKVKPFNFYIHLPVKYA